MALEEFENRQLSEREKNLVRMRSITNYVMGTFIVLAGLFFLFPFGNAKPYIEKSYDPVMIKLFAGLCFIYGAFRIYRGYKKNYFN